MGQFTFYASSDPGAPVLDGLQGTLTDVLDWVLNAGEGWTIEFTDTAKRVYRPPSGTRFYYRVDDNSPDPASANYVDATLIGYETMSDIDTGTGLFGNCVITKSNAASSDSRAWVCFADDRTCYLYIYSPGHTTFYNATGFGDFYSLMAFDSYNAFVCSKNTFNDTSGTSERFGKITRLPSGTGEFHVARSFSQIGPTINCGMHGDYKYNSTVSFAGTLVYPNIDEAVMLCRAWIHEPVSSGIRGYARGLWVPLHAAASFADGSTAIGQAEISTRTFKTVKGVYGGSGGLGVHVIETSNTVETNA